MQLELMEYLRIAKMSKPIKSQELLRAIQTEKFKKLDDVVLNWKGGSGLRSKGDRWKIQLGLP